MKRVPESDLLWTQPHWLEQATRWIRAELERLDTSINGAIEQPHVRPWSTVLRVPTRGGDVFFKAIPPILGQEVAITLALARWRPDCMPQVLATDLERGWMLMADGGTRLRSVIESTRDIEPWRNVLPIYAELQIEMSNHAEELLALGAPDRRLAFLPDQYERLLKDSDVLRVDRSPGITSEEYRRLRDLSPRFAALCAELAEYRIPESLHHGDFHDGNIFVNGAHYIFFDWGDCCVTHPFFSFRTVMASNENSLGLAGNAVEHAQLRDIYLESWTRSASRENLLAAFKIAQRLWMIPTALAWHRIISSLDAAPKEQFAEPVPALLREFLDTEAQASA